MDERQRKAAQLSALGWGTGAIAKQLGVSAKTVQRWKQLPDFMVHVRDHEPDASVMTTLEAALQATKRDGTPDWPTRVSAAKALAALRPVAPEDQTPRTVTIFKQRTA